MIEPGTRVRYIGNVMAWNGYTGKVVKNDGKQYEKSMVAVQFDMIDADNTRYFEPHNLEILKYEIVDIADKHDWEEYIKDDFFEEPSIEDLREASYRDEMRVFTDTELESMPLEVYEGIKRLQNQVSVFTTARHPNSQRFHELLREAGDLHDRKQQDYGRGDDPFANVRGSTEWGIAPWMGAMVRAQDKIKRLQKFARDGNLANESVIDSFMDLAVYALIARVLFEEGRDGV